MATVTYEFQAIRAQRWSDFMAKINAAGKECWSAVSYIEEPGGYCLLMQRANE